MKKERSKQASWNVSSVLRRLLSKQYKWHSQAMAQPEQYRGSTPDNIPLLLHGGILVAILYEAYV